MPDDNLSLLKKWYDEESGDDNWLRGVEARPFRDDSCRQDLMSLKGREGKEDPIAVFIADRVLPVYDRTLGHRLHRSMSSKASADAREYHMKTLVRLASAICMILSAALPAISILVLYNLRHTVARLAAIVVMSLVFSLVMTLVAQKKADVFISVAAYSAVMVVFVGSANVMN